MSIHSHRTIDESKQQWERHPVLFVMDDSGDRLRTIMEYKMGIGPANPTQVMVDNPEFEYGKLGWTSTTGAQNQLIATNQSGAITGNFFESWDANSYTGEIFQEQVVPNGTYRVTVAAFRNSAVNSSAEENKMLRPYGFLPTKSRHSSIPQRHCSTVSLFMSMTRDCVSGFVR